MLDQDSKAIFEAYQNPSDPSPIDWKEMGLMIRDVFLDHKKTEDERHTEIAEIIKEFGGVLNDDVIQSITRAEEQLYRGSPEDQPFYSPAFHRQQMRRITRNPATWPPEPYDEGNASEDIVGAVARAMRK